MTQFTNTLDTVYVSDETLPNREFDILSLLMVPVLMVVRPGGTKVNINLDQLYKRVSNYDDSSLIMNHPL